MGTEFLWCWIRAKKTTAKHGNFLRKIWMSQFGGLDEKLYYHAVAKLLELDPAERVDLVRIEDAQDSLRDAIHQDGVLL
jgi:hypothetical protein